jgi:hypothetical protein
MGFCANQNRGGGMGRGGGGMGRGGGGMGRGRGGMGRGRGRGGRMGPGQSGAGDRFVDAPVRDDSDDLNALRAESSRLKELLESIEQRLAKFKTPEKER